MTVPVLPVVMFQADTTSVAARSMVDTPCTVALGFGVSMYHWPLAVLLGWNSGSFGTSSA